MTKVLIGAALGVMALTATAPVLAQDNPFMVRLRAVHLNWDNGQNQGVKALDIEAKNKTIPEVDFSYFFTKNIAAELVLTYPQRVSVDSNIGRLGSVKALPPSLLLQYHFTDFGQFKPYVGLGVNYTLFTDRKVLDGAAKIDKSSVGYAAQIGFDYMFDKNWGLNVDLKYADIDTDVKVGGTKIGKLDLNPTMFGVGLTYKY